MSTILSPIVATVKQNTFHQELVKMMFISQNTTFKFSFISEVLIKGITTLLL